MAKLSFDELVDAANHYSFKYIDVNDVMSSLVPLNENELRILNSTIISKMSLDEYDSGVIDKSKYISDAINNILDVEYQPRPTHKTKNYAGVKEALKLLEEVQVSGLDNVLKFAKAVEILKSI